MLKVLHAAHSASYWLRALHATVAIPLWPVSKKKIHTMSTQRFAIEESIIFATVRWQCPGWYVALKHKQFLVQQSHGPTQSSGGVCVDRWFTQRLSGRHFVCKLQYFFYLIAALYSKRKTFAVHIQRLAMSTETIDIGRATDRYSDDFGDLLESGSRSDVIITAPIGLFDRQQGDDAIMVTFFSSRLRFLPVDVTSAPAPRCCPAGAGTRGRGKWAHMQNLIKIQLQYWTWHLNNGASTWYSYTLPATFLTRIVQFDWLFGSWEFSMKTLYWSGALLREREWHAPYEIVFI